MNPLFEDRFRPMFTVGQVADLLEVQQAFLRRLDRQDVVRPARSEGAQRRYSQADVERIVAACGLIEEGLSLEGVRRVMALQAEVDRLRRELDDARRTLRKRAARGPGS